MGEIPTTEAAKRSRAGTRRRLVAKAAPVFVDKGVELASVADLCAAAGFTRGAFYSNFESKAELAVAVYEYRVDTLVDLLHAEVESHLTRGVPVAEVLGFVLEALAGMTEDGAWQGFRLEMHLMADRDEQLRSQVDEQYERIVAAVADALALVGRHGVSYRLPELDFARLLIAVWDGELLRSGRRTTAHARTGAKLITATWEAFTVVGDSLSGP